jgi:hypothetical protein
MIQKDVENPWKTLGTWSTLGYPIGDITRKKHDEGFHWDIIFPFSCFLWTFTGNNHSIYSTGSAIGKWAEHIFTRMNCRKPQNGNLAIYWVRFYIFLSFGGCLMSGNEFIISRSCDGNRRVPGWNVPHYWSAWLFHLTDGCNELPTELEDVPSKPGLLALARLVFRRRTAAIPGYTLPWIPWPSLGTPFPQVSPYTSHPLRVSHAVRDGVPILRGA